MVRDSVEEMLKELLENEAESLMQAACYERSETRQGYHSGHYDRNLTTTSGDTTLQCSALGNASLIGTSFRYGSPIMLLCSLYLIDEVLAIILFYRSEMTDGIGNP